jgi:hypothetical protein
MINQSDTQCEILSTICADEMGEAYRAAISRRHLLEAMKTRYCSLDTPRKSSIGE